MTKFKDILKYETYRFENTIKLERLLVWSLNYFIHLLIFEKENIIKKNSNFVETEWTINNKCKTALKTKQNVSY